VALSITRAQKHELGLEYCAAAIWEVARDYKSNFLETVTHIFCMKPPAADKINMTAYSSSWAAARFVKW
jgi:hypothetical protein